MSWCTVCWHEGAHAQLAEIWLAAADRPAISASANEIDQLLRFQPAAKGRRVLAGSLQPVFIDLLHDRRGSIPEDARLLQFGPLEVVFTAHEMDAQARGWVLARRGECLK